MVIVEILGGLGNQMFQYAAGRRVAATEKQPLYLDLTGFTERGYTLHQFSLDKLKARYEVAGSSDIRRLRGSGSRVLPRFARNWWHLRRGTYYREPKSGFDPAFGALKPPVYLRGYFQSETYFEPIAELLRAEFELDCALSADSDAALGTIQMTNCPVAVHIRRGDYVSDAETAMIHGSCSPDYYQRAVEHLASQFGELDLFLFSDEPDWARNNLSLPGTVRHVSENGPDRNHEDLWLMSQCRHFVIANSSFSWWGAWLGMAADKQVVAPKQWFRDASIPSGHRVPTKWITI